MERRDQSYERKDFGWLVLMSLLFFGLVAIALWRELHPEWLPVQMRFRAALEQYARVEDARKFTSGTKQIWVPRIGVVDRCVTCHLGYNWGAVLPASLPEPLTPHPVLPFMNKHPFAEFGCTPCHGGQGWATTEHEAHSGGENWNDPLISNKLAKRYDLTQAQLMQMRCNFCHRRDVVTPWMDEINLAKKLLLTKKCLVCHEVEGEGGNQGRELTFYGDTNPELIDFSRIGGAHTLFNFAYLLLMSPDVVMPTSPMPTFHFRPNEARALALMLLSWRRQIFPPEYLPPPIESETPAATPSPAASASPSAAGH